MKLENASKLKHIFMEILKIYKKFDKQSSLPEFANFNEI